MFEAKGGNRLVEFLTDQASGNLSKSIGNNI